MLPKSKQKALEIYERLSDVNKVKINKLAFKIIKTIMIKNRPRSMTLIKRVTNKDYLKSLKETIEIKQMFLLRKELKKMSN